ncbi:hypothetical protein LZ32DRAFT_310870 [Colletotrichum eremochloae]|nr:hypothetical protein LZ32DRAFT_310870 [Colletotrichum eremochloae]
MAPACNKPPHVGLFRCATRILFWRGGGVHHPSSALWAFATYLPRHRCSCTGIFLPLFAFFCRAVFFFSFFSTIESGLGYAVSAQPQLTSTIIHQQPHRREP